MLTLKKAYYQNLQIKNNKPLKIIIKLSRLIKIIFQLIIIELIIGIQSMRRRKQLLIMIKQFHQTLKMHQHISKELSCSQQSTRKIKLQKISQNLYKLIPDRVQFQCIEGIYSKNKIQFLRQFKIIQMLFKFVLIKHRYIQREVFNHLQITKRLYKIIIMQSKLIQIVLRLFIREVLLFLKLAILNKCIYRNDLAIADFNICIQINPKSELAYISKGHTQIFIIGLILNEMNKPEQAVIEYNKALLINPNNFNITLKRAYAYILMKLYKQALNDFSTVIEMYPNESSYYTSRGLLIMYNIANLLFNIGQKEEALKDYNKAIELNPKDATYYYNRAVFYNKVNLKEMSLQDYNMTIELDPKNYSAYNNRGLLLQSIGKKDEALQDFLNAIRLCPDHPLYLANLGDQYYSDHQFELANQYYKQAQTQIECISLQKLNQLRLNIEHLNFIKTKVQLITQIEDEIKKMKKQIEQLPKTSSNNEQIKECLEKVSTIERSLSYSVLPCNQEQQSDAQQTIISFYQQMQKQLKELYVKLDQQDKVINLLVQQDQFKIEQQMKEIKLPQNKHQFTYFRSLFWHLYYYLHAMSEISTNLFQVNTNAMIESSSEKVINLVKKTFNIGTKVLDKVHIAAHAFHIINEALNIVVDHKREEKFKKRLMLLTNILKLFAITPTELEREVQFTAIELSRTQQTGLKENQNSRFIEFIKKLAEEESISEEKSKDIFWKKGIEDTFIILRYLEKFNQKIIQEDQNKKLSEVFLEAIKFNIIEESSKKQKDPSQTQMKQKKPKKKFQEACNIQ
ncbi:unnamed protein product (macronuclear) [Paramecium tetraurelia]|uniref:Uncharacterized protein n=1 Tax=Paramecium tetraurelia TaxID=5888 RepID=A0BQM5_PARTE|nr:uncharacterized protein GSPATT00031071001 [Paramecium tetraurelia]CAK60842.1 unnamed protein product [Paramecium tetraurelia]|eukprot:XP_001428240.1 hypothetical protein (macronuclear) [Paramecium tetraurelia strain d4-2]